MTNYIKQCFLLLLLFMLIGIQMSYAQDLEIAGDTIYVNAEAEVMVRFPTLPTFFNTIPSNAPYNFKTAGTGFTIIAKTERTKSAPLLVTEGGRNHKFVIVFKKNIDYNNDAEMDYDYSTTKKLEQHIRDQASAKMIVSKNPEASGKETKKSKKDKSAENTAANYYALLEQGDMNIKQQDYTSAKLNFEKAATLRPNDQIPKQRLDEIRIRLADKEKNSSLELNKQYIDIIATAKSNFNAKKYAKAQDNYKKALDIKPGDNYAKRQLEIIEAQLTAETDKNEQQKLDNLYKEYITSGDKALKKEKLIEARVSYEQALVIKQNDGLATNQLKKIDDLENREKEKSDLEVKYTSTIENADKLFKAGDYENAKAAYIKVSGLTKKSYPLDQITKINKLQAEALAKENADKQKRLSDLALEQKNKEKNRLEADYNAAIKTADKLYTARDFENAILAYNKAISIDKRAWPTEQLKTIQKLREKEDADKKKMISQLETERQVKERIKQEEKEKQTREKDYKALIKEADKLFNKNKYEASKIEYVKASVLSNDKWPVDQIAVIDKIFEEQRVKEKADKIKLTKEIELNTQYTAVIDKALIEFGNGNYLKARKLYADAALLKPLEKLPIDKINQIQLKLDQIATAEKLKKDSIASAVEMKKKYILVMSKAKSYYLKADFVSAKKSYQEAVQLNPLEEEPKIQLKDIQTKLEAVSKATEVDRKFEQKVSTGDSFLIAKAYENAIAAYKDALTIKPNEYYPKTQINYITAEIKNVQKENEDRAKLAAYKKEEELDLKYRDALKRADQAVREKNYAMAKVAYSEVLAIRPDHDYAKQRLEIVNYQMAKEINAKNKKTEIAKSDIAKPVVPEKINTEIKPKDKPPIDAPLVKMAPPPYSNAELKAKYPTIDFTTLPPEQPFNEGAVNTMENASIFRDMVAATPRLTINTTEDKIKLTCQAIDFEGSSVYIKFLIQNNSKTDFLTGAMMLTWTKRSGNRIKLYPVYLFPAFLPIVTPGNEAVVIYVCKSYYINDTEKLNFELSDRLNKVKLGIDIPGTKYNEEEGRY